jgi:hypothetical protein
MGKFIKLSAKKYKTIKELAEYLVAKKRTISIDEIFDAIDSFKMQYPNLLDGIEYGSRHKTHTNYIFMDKKHPENSFTGINAHNAGNKGGVFPASVSQLARFLIKAVELRTLNGLSVDLGPKVRKSNSRFNKVVNNRWIVK